MVTWSVCWFWFRWDCPHLQWEAQSVLLWAPSLLGSWSCITWWSMFVYVNVVTFIVPPTHSLPPSQPPRRKKIDRSISASKQLQQCTMADWLYVSLPLIKTLGHNSIHLHSKDTVCGPKCLFLNTYNTFVTSKKWTTSLKKSNVSFMWRLHCIRKGRTLPH